MFTSVGQDFPAPSTAYPQRKKESPPLQFDFKKLKIEARENPDLIGKIVTKIDDPKKRYKLAKIVASQETGTLYLEIGLYKLGNSSDRFELAKKDAIKHPKEVFENLDNYNLDENQRFEIAKVIGKPVLNDIKKLDLTQNHRYELAQLLVKKLQADLSPYIEQFDLTNEQNFELAKEEAGRSTGKVCQYIKNYHLTPEQLFEVAKIAKSQALEFIENFGFDQSQRFEIAAISRFVGKNIKKCDLTQEQRDEIAKNEAKLGLNISIYIQDYDLDENQRFEVAKLAVGNERVAPFIKNFDLNQEHRFEIAKLVAKEGAIKGSIQNFDLNQIQRFEVAKLDAKKGYISDYIEGYELTNEQNFEIAKIAAAKGKITESIKKYNLDQEERFAVAKLSAAKQDISESIKEYELNQEQRFAVAKIEAATEDNHLSTYIQDFDLSEEQRFEIASVSAENDKDFFENRENYSLSGEQTFYIIKSLALHKPKRIAKELFKLNLKKEQLEEIYKSLAHNAGSWKIFIKKIEEISLEELTKGTGLDKVVRYHEAVQSMSNELYKDNPTMMNAINQYLDESVKEHLVVRHHILDWIMSINKLAIENKFQSDDSKFILPMLNNLATLPDPILRNKLTKQLMNSYLRDGSSTLKNVQMELADNQPQKSLMSQLLAPLAEAGEKATAKSFINAFFSNKKMSSSGATQRSVLELLLVLKEKGWNPQEQAKLLQVLVKDIPLEEVKPPAIPRGLSKEKRKEALEAQKKELERPNLLFARMTRNVQIASDLILLKKENALKEAASLDEIENIMVQMYGEILGDNKIDGISEKYLATFGQFRNKQALWTYYAKLSTLEPTQKKAALPMFQLYVASVLEGTFSKTRYQETKHLTTIFGAREDLRSIWKGGATFSEEELLQEESGRDSLSNEVLIPFFQKKVLKKGHLDQEEIYPHLFEFLKNPQKIEEISQKIQLKRIAIIKENKEKGADKKANAEALNRLRLEQCFLDVCNSEENKEKKMQELFRVIPQNVKFKKDLEKLMSTTQAKNTTNSYYQFILSDDPCDFLLMGAEVTGSCQNVTHDPQLSKGLLGYMLNGQTLLLLVKNSKGEMESRAAIRMLWDDVLETPIYHLGPIYQRKRDPEQEKYILEMAKRFAKKSKVPLVAVPPKVLDSDNILMSSKPTTPYTHSIRSLGGVCPFEYLDGSHAGITDSRFEISGKELERLI